MGLRLDDRWLWDFWLAGGDERTSGAYHLFFLQAPRAIGDPDQRHWNVSIGHAVSSDLRRWEPLPDVLAPAPAGAWDDYTTWTGSVLHHDGQWWMFYTGTSHQEDGKVQRVGLATSEDLLTWHRYGDRPLVESDPRWYEQYDPSAWPELAWRDPWVFQDPDSGEFTMLVTARAREGDPATRGVIGLVTSPDLLSWTVRPPVTRPGVFGHLEIPQLVRVGAGWQLLFSTPPAPASVRERMPATGHTGTHLLSAPRAHGPFEWSSHRALDADPAGTRYGGRLVATRSGWQLLTWLDTGPDGGFVGELADPVPVAPHGAGLIVGDASG